MRIGLISTRLAGTDGVSLETGKIAEILKSQGHQIFYCAGELDPTSPPGRLVPAMHFAHPAIKEIHDTAFGGRFKPAGFKQRVKEWVAALKQEITLFVTSLDIEQIIVQNALSIPMNIPLGVALTDYIEETGIPSIVHNHDLYWERNRFETSCIPEILSRCFPPNSPSARHLVINSLAQQALREKKGIDSRLLPNVFDFVSAPPQPDAYNRDLRQVLGLSDRDLVFLQPTRVVPRKGIELSIALLGKLRKHQDRLGGREPVLLISHAAGDEGNEYLASIKSLAAASSVTLIHAADRFAPVRGSAQGKKLYALWDAYLRADFVTFPSLVEGFGNALLEATYFRLPVLVNSYAVYAADIAPLGFDHVVIDGKVTERTVGQVLDILLDPEKRRISVNWNFNLAAADFSYETAGPILADLLASDEST